MITTAAVRERDARRVGQAVMKLDDALTGVDSLGFDTAPIIYFVEAHPHYDTLVTEIFRRVATGAMLGVTRCATGHDTYEISAHMRYAPTR